MLTTIEPTTAINSPGTLGANFLHPRMIAITDNDTHNVVTLVSGMSLIVPHSFLRLPPDGVGTPIIPAS